MGFMYHQSGAGVKTVGAVNSWQLDWNMQTDNKLHAIKPVLGVWDSSSHRQCRFEVPLYCSRIGHSSLTHLYLLCGEDVKLSVYCGKVLTVLLYYGSAEV
ncbi:hypothetical protein ANAPC5_01450 [Anaplasma phagocytophilum]|nr:hypothetical protein ANAPC5_01450 [Anaplasma phagocytophilum]